MALLPALYPRLAALAARCRAALVMGGRCYSFCLYLGVVRDSLPAIIPFLEPLSWVPLA